MVQAKILGGVSFHLWSVQRDLETILRYCNPVEDELAVLVMDYVAPRSGGELGARERVEGGLIDVVSARTVLASECLKKLYRVEDVADVQPF